MKKYGFIGAGKMASAIVKGLLKNVASAQEIVCTCGNDDTGKILAQQTSISLQKQTNLVSILLSNLSLKTKVFTSLLSSAKQATAKWYTTTFILAKAQM